MHVRWLIPLSAAAASQAAFATQYMTVAQAQHEAFPAADSFAAVALPDAATLAAIGAPPGWSPQVSAALAGEKKLGWIFVDQVIGKSEAITYALALDAHGAVLSLEVLDYRESHGGEVRMPAWRRQFVGKTVADAAALNREIKIISGATLSCRHLTEGVQRLLRLYQAALQAPT